MLANDCNDFTKLYQNVDKLFFNFNEKSCRKWNI